MSKNLKRIQDIGYYPEAVDGTSQISLTNTPKHFGTYRQQRGNQPEEIQEFFQAYKGGSYDPYITQVSKSHMYTQLAYTPSDSLPWYHALGGASVNAGVITLDPIQEGELPPLSERYENSNNTQYTRKDVVGNRVKRLSSTIAFAQPTNYLVDSISIFGIKQETPAVDQRIAPVFADAGTQAQQKEFQVENKGATFLWDVGGDEVELIDYLVDITYIHDTRNFLDWIDGQIYPKIAKTSARAQALNFRMRSSNENSVIDDMQNQRDTNDFKDAKLRLYNDYDNDKYREYNFTEVACNVKQPHALSNKEPIYDVTAIITSLDSMVINDDVPDALYGL